MAKTTRKIFLRQSTAADLRAILRELAQAQQDSAKAVQHLEAAIAKLQSTIKLADSLPAPGYRPMPAAIRRRLKTLEAKTQEALDVVRKWPITQDEPVIQKVTGKGLRGGKLKTGF